MSQDKQPMRNFILGIYDLTYKDKKFKRKVHNLIDRKLEKFTTKQWDELTEIEKDRFAYVIIKEDMLKRYVTDDYARSKVLKKIDNYVNEMLNCADYALQLHNISVSKMFIEYCKEDDPEEKKIKAYEVFCSDFREINSEYPLPTKKEWISRPLRIYDYLMNEDEERNASFDPTELYVTREEKNDEIIKVIIKIISEQLKISIDVPLIEKCLLSQKRYNKCHSEKEELLREYDPSLPISKEEQIEIISNNREIFKHLKMLKELNFYKHSNS